MKARTLICCIIALFLSFTLTARAADQILITEFMAANDGILLDEDGDSEDWVELHNAGTNVVNLDGWYLTDKVAQPTQWRFPATNLPPNGYLVVFASSKNRRVPGAPLHTNFKLDNGGEYLALIKPDGVTVAWAFDPAYPFQISGVSYGFPVVPTVTTLLPTGAVARVQVPLDGSLESSWALPGFNDSSWAALPTGVGYETDGLANFTPTTNASSVADFSGTQGQNNWFYGYWDRKSDGDGIYAASEFTPFPNAGGGWSSGNFWNGSIWDWFAGDPPFTQLTSGGGRPSSENGNAALPDHWAVRRYVNETNSPLTISGRITHTSDWVYVTQTGVAGNAFLYLYLLGTGEAYIDDIKLVAGAVPEAGANLISNGDFESGVLQPWNVSLNMGNSSASTAFKHGGTRSMRMVATAAGSTQSDSIWQPLSVTAGAIYTLSYWFLPVTNQPPTVVRSSGGWLYTEPTAPGDGAVARIYVDGTEVFQEAAFVSSRAFSITVPAQLGSTVDFVLEAGPLNNDLGDASGFTATITTADPTLLTVADSVADWSVNGVQGEKNWFYGYYFEGTTVTTPPYYTSNFVAFPRDNGPYGPNNFWKGEAWKWFNGDPPLDEIGPELMVPTGLNNLIRHWVIRRWISTVSGNATLTWTMAKPAGTGAGVTGRILHNGVQRDALTLGTNSFKQFRTVALTNLQVGDIIEVALDPTGFGGGFGDGGDECYVTATIRGAPSLTRNIASNLQGAMQGVNATAYLRLPFNVANPGAVQFLTLRMKYDDGFAAYLNGQLVASANAPGSPDWNSTATTARTDTDANAAQDFNLTAFAGLLQPGANVLAIRGLNASAGDSDFLILPELLATSVAVNTNTPRYFTQVTPGAANGAGTGNFGPIIRDAAHEPKVPQDQDGLHITATVLATVLPVDVVSLTYRVMFSNEVTVPMFDDGAHGDGLAGDGLFGATVPASASQPGQMVRYFIYATDIAANASRFPAYDNPQDSPAYLGTVVSDPTQTNKLPVLHVFTANPTQTTNYVGTRCSIFYDEEFYDNVAISLHGQTTAAVFWKQSLDISMNRGETFRWKRGVERVDSFNLLSPISDKAYLRQIMAYETFANAGIPGSQAFPLRIQQNGAFYGVFHFVEKGDEHLLERAGLDPDGAFYKMYLPMTGAYAGVAEKKTRPREDFSDLQALIDGCNLASDVARRQFIYDNIDVPEVVNFLATINLVQNEDCCYYKNYFLYRDSNKTKEWQMLPWDLDLTFGRTFGFLIVNGIQTNGYFNTNIFWTNAYYLQVRPSPIGAADFIGQEHVVAEALWSVPEIYQMFRRRWTSVHEQFLQKSGTHPLLLHYERRTDELAAQIEPDATLDMAKWGSWFPVQTMPVAVDILKKIYFEKRRGWIFNTLAAANGGPYLGTQPTNASIRFGAIEPNPSNGNQDQEYVELVNTNNYAVDISGWRVTGAIDHTFKQGVVLPANSSLYLSPDVNAFRARASGPRGGIGLFVQGNYAGRLNARGEALQIVDATGRAVTATNVPAAPSLAQQYLRITEIMYRPTPPPPGLPALADEFEFLELKNIGPSPLSLLGVRLTNGIDFGFTGSAVTNLAPGASVLVVRNLAAFESRYGGGLPVAGQYSGLLDNAGENLRLEDATGEKILDFDYNNSWYPITDGVGFSLVIVNENADWSTWGLKESWRPSSRERGSPGTNNPAADVVAPVLVNEVASHTVPPAIDAVELHNPTGGSVDLGGWFLTDDFLTPRKFRIPDLTTITTGGYLVFNEGQFNPTNPPSPTGFAFSSFGDEVFLFSANAAGELTGYHHGFRFGAAEAGVPFGRHVNLAGAEHFVAQSAATLGSENFYPQVGPVVISEIHYHPPDFAGGADNSADEFIEVQNIGGAAAPLFHAAFPTNTWHLRGDVDFDFPTNVTLPSGGFALIVSFDPASVTALAAFRARFKVPPAVPVFGPWSGQLNNASGEVRLTKPGLPLAGETPRITADEVDYEDAAPWPGEADGHGASLQIYFDGIYGNDAFSWTQGAPGAGAAYIFGSPPFISAQPASQVIFGSAPVTFSVLAAGFAPLSYQWEFNGATIAGATGASHTISYVLPEHAGFYRVTVLNGAGATVSSNALLTVAYGPFFTRQPTNFPVRAGQTATFTAAAIGTGPVTYQWQFNGTNAPGTVTSTSTNTTLTITNVQPFHAGAYTALATDSIGTVPALPAELIYLVNPTIVQQPLSQSAVPGANVTFSVVVTNTATLPVGYRWRRNGQNISGAFFSQNGFTNFFTATNVQLPLTNYSVSVTNASLPNGTVSSIAFLTIHADADGDGIPDNWETLFGLLPGSNTDRDLDADGDRMSNWEEYIAGTNPTNAASYLKVELLSVGGGAGLTFGAVSGRTYTVQFTDTLGSGEWTKLGDFPARATNHVGVMNDPGFTTNRFYRIATPQQP